MKCSICYGTIQNNKISLLGKDICGLCLKSIGELDVDDIFYDFYKDRIKSIIKLKLLPPLSQQP
jgi:hypothetical protein